MDENKRKEIYVNWLLKELDISRKEINSVNTIIHNWLFKLGIPFLASVSLGVFYFQKLFNNSEFLYSIIGIALIIAGLFFTWGVGLYNFILARIYHEIEVIYPALIQITKSKFLIFDLYNKIHKKIWFRTGIILSLFGYITYAAIVTYWSVIGFKKNLIKITALNHNLLIFILLSITCITLITLLIITYINIRNLMKTQLK